MAKSRNNRTKKAKGIQQHKQMLEQHRKEYFHRLNKIAQASGAYEVFKKLSKKELVILEYSKVSAFRVEEANPGRLKNQELKILKSYVSDYMKFTKFTIKEGYPQISLHDYFSAGVGLRHYLRVLEDDEYPLATEIKEAFADFMKMVNEDDIPRQLLGTQAQAMAWTISTIDKGYFWFEYSVVAEKGLMGYDCYKTYIFEPEIKHFKINGTNRPAFRIGFVQDKDGVTWMKLKAAKLGNNSSFADLALDIYIQSHALLRLKERLDGFIDPELHSNLFLSLLMPRVVENFQGKSLIEYRFYQDKVGYLVAEIVDGAVLIKTFLLLTNDGTPEGAKLKELAGLSQVDKKYFEIDKLSTFLYSDISANPELKSVFVKAGCENLFTVESIRKQNHEQKKAAAPLLKYLNQSKEVVSLP